MGWAARANKARQLPPRWPHVLPEEQRQLFLRAFAFFKKQNGMPRREKHNRAQDLADRACAELEQQRVEAERKVRPAQQSGLIKPRQSLLITPDEFRELVRGR